MKQNVFVGIIPSFYIPLYSQNIPLYSQNTLMIRKYIKEKLRQTLVKTFGMEFDVEDRNPAAASTNIPNKKDVIPKIVDGSGDTPGPNHKTKIGRTWLSAQLLAGGELCIIDIRSPQEVVSGILPKAHILPQDSIRQRLDILPILDPQKVQTIVVYDQTGDLGSEAIAAWLREQGWIGARHLDGGFAQWIEQGEDIIIPQVSIVHPDKRYSIGDAVHIPLDVSKTDASIAYILQVQEHTVELWNPQDGYLGHIAIRDL